MHFYSVRELRADTRQVCEDIRQSGEAVLTHNGKPSVLMLDINEDNFEDTLQAVRQARALLAMTRMQAIAAEAGYMTEAEIEAEIQAARAEREVRQGA